MILTFGLLAGQSGQAGLAGAEASFGPAALGLAMAAVLAYGLAAWPGAAAARWQALALPLGWALHGVLLALDVGGWGRVGAGARLGFGPVLSLTVWLVLAVHAVESRLLPLPAVRRVLAGAGALAVLLAWGFPGEMRPPTSAWAPLHWALGVAAYALIGAAALHAWMLDSAETAMRSRATSATAGPTSATAGPTSASVGPTPAPLGLPLLRLERLTFGFVDAGFAVLSAALVLGALSAAQWRWSHKTVFSVLAWAVFALLLWGRHARGWRGRRATRWLYVGAALLLLGYAGSSFVFEVLLGRSPV